METLLEAAIQALGEVFVTLIGPTAGAGGKPTTGEWIARGCIAAMLIVLVGMIILAASHL